MERGKLAKKFLNTPYLLPVKKKKKSVALASIVTWKLTDNFEENRERLSRSPDIFSSGSGAEATR